MKTYKIIVAHDKGIFTIHVTANNKNEAMARVMKVENCPSYAILSVKKI